MAYRPTYKAETDALILKLIPQTPTIAALCAKGIRKGAVRASIKRLYEAGRITRLWNGDAKHGHYVYSIP